MIVVLLVMNLVTSILCPKKTKTEKQLESLDMHSTKREQEFILQQNTDTITEMAANTARNSG